MKKQTKRRRNKHNKRRNNKTKKHYKRRNHHVYRKRNLREFIPGNKGQLFSMPETQKSVEIIVDNNHKQFGNIIPGLREM
jgi:hypothetical protein